MSEYVTFETCYQLAHALFAVPGVTTADDARAVMAKFYRDPPATPVDSVAALNRRTLDQMIDSVGESRQTATTTPREPAPAAGTPTAGVSGGR